MSFEGQSIDKKSLRVLDDGDKGLKELAKDCVAFANARGGSILIGIEDDEAQPPADQRVAPALVERLRKRIPELTVNAGVDAQVRSSQDGGEFIELRVYPSALSIAATSDGRYYMRVTDVSRPLMPEELTRVLDEKGAFCWEMHHGVRASADRMDAHKTDSFLRSIRRSRRVSDFVRAKTDEEILEHYFLVLQGKLTNLGVLWVGRREDRARLRYAPQVQCIRFGESSEKVNKWVWLEHELNPLELIEAIWKEVPDWSESEELPDGLFRTNIPHYDEVIVRELLANALVHRPYTQAGDIFVHLHPDRLEVLNPGPLPFGVTPENILHKTVKRNEHLARVFYDLGLMESEGSGYDRMYEVLLSSGKPQPAVRDGHDRVLVTVQKRVVNPAISDFLGKVNQRFELTQKERITLGLVAQHESITSTELRRSIGIGEGEDWRPWLGRLVDWSLLQTSGRTKGVRYSVNAALLRNLQFTGNTSLKGIQPHRLRELILEDLRRYGRARIGEIQARIGPEIPRHHIRNELVRLIDGGRVRKEGTRSTTRYLMEEPEQKQ